MNPRGWGHLTGTALLQREDFDSEEKFEEAVGLPRASQELRIAQAKFNSPMVATCVALLLIKLRGEADSLVPLLCFGFALVGSLILRAIVAQMIRAQLPRANPAQLQTFETWLVYPGCAASAAMDPGFWLVASSDVAEFDITRSCCLFSISIREHCEERIHVGAEPVSIELGKITITATQRKPGGPPSPRLVRVEWDNDELTVTGIGL